MINTILYLALQILFHENFHLLAYVFVQLVCLGIMVILSRIVLPLLFQIPYMVFVGAAVVIPYAVVIKLWWYFPTFTYVVFILAMCCTRVRTRIVSFFKYINCLATDCFDGEPHSVYSNSDFNNVHYEKRQIHCSEMRVKEEVAASCCETKTNNEPCREMPVSMKHEEKLALARFSLRPTVLEVAPSPLAAILGCKYLDRTGMPVKAPKLARTIRSDERMAELIEQFEAMHLHDNFGVHEAARSHVSSAELVAENSNLKEESSLVVADQEEKDASTRDMVREDVEMFFDDSYNVSSAERAAENENSSLVVADQEEETTSTDEITEEDIDMSFDDSFFVSSAERGAENSNLEESSSIVVADQEEEAASTGDIIEEDVEMFFDDSSTTSTLSTTFSGGTDSTSSTEDLLEHLPAASSGGNDSTLLTEDPLEHLPAASGGGNDSTLLTEDPLEHLHAASGGGNDSTLLTEDPLEHLPAASGGGNDSTSLAEDALEHLAAIFGPGSDSTLLTGDPVVDFLSCLPAHIFAQLNIDFLLTLDRATFFSLDWSVVLDNNILQTVNPASGALNPLPQQTLPLLTHQESSPSAAQVGNFVVNPSSSDAVYASSTLPPDVGEYSSVSAAENNYLFVAPSNDNAQEGAMPPMIGNTSSINESTTFLPPIPHFFTLSEDELRQVNELLNAVGSDTEGQNLTDHQVSQP